MTGRLRYGSVCSGVGSCRLASPASWDCAFFSEIDPFASAVLAHHYPEVQNRGDFTQIDESVGPVDVLVGGTPCQSFSVAGKRGGLDTPNGDLALEFARLARRLRARWIVWENVPGVLSSAKGRDFDTFLDALEQCGYSVAWRVLDAQWFGVPQRRRRVFVVGYLGDWRPPAAVLFEPESLRGDSAPSREAREDVAGTLGRGAGERGWSPDTDRMTFVPVTAPALTAREGKGANSDCTSAPLITHALDAHSHGAATEDGTGRGVPLVAHALSSEGADASEDGTGRGTPLVPYVADPVGANEGRTYSNAGNGHVTGGVPFVTAFSCKDSGDDAGELSPTLRSLDFDKSHANGGGQVAVAFAENQRGELRTSDTMPSISTSGGKPGSGYPAVAFQESQTGCREYPEAGTLRANGPGHDPVGTRIRSGMSVRRLTPAECEALQGLPRNHTLVPYRGKPAADAPRYRAIGNGWAIPVVRWILDRLDTVDRIVQEAT